MADILFDDLVSGSDLFFDFHDSGLYTAGGAGDTAEASASDATVFTGTAANASGQGDEASASASEASAIGYAYVTIADPYTGYGSIFYPSNFDGDPAEGDIVRYPTTDGFKILSDGTIVAEEYGEYVCYYDDGDGEVEFTVVINDNAYVHAEGASAEASASDASLYGGVNISGAGDTAEAIVSTGSATVGIIASGAGDTAEAEASEATASGGAAASGEGAEATTDAAEAIAEIEVSASGAADTVEASAAEATAVGDVQPEGAGVTVSVTAATGTAVGDAVPGTLPYAALTTAYPSRIYIPRAA